MVVDAPKPLNPTESAAVQALLMAMRAFRAQSPASNYRTAYEVVVNNVVSASYKLRVEVQIRE